MHKIKKFDIDIIRLNNSDNIFEYILKNDFFKLFPNNPITDGELTSKIVLNVLENKIIMIFNIKGYVNLICDRSLEEFKYPLSINKKVFFEYGDRNEELSIDKYLINDKTYYINVAQHLHDFINLAVPIKKLHPKFLNETDGDEVVYKFNL